MDKSTASTFVSRDKQAQLCSITSRAGVKGEEGEKKKVYHIKQAWLKLSVAFLLLQMGLGWDLSGVEDSGLG